MSRLRQGMRRKRQLSVNPGSPSPVWNQHIFLGIVDPKTGQVLELGEIGEIVVTRLLLYDMPILRYHIQDLGYIEPIPVLAE
jgi:phenylacetate-coenzyme A ligase PaaK-like adenylate-forming protein